MKKTTKLTLRKLSIVLGIFLLGILIGKYDKTTYETGSKPVIERSFATSSSEVKRELTISPRPTDKKRDAGAILVGGFDIRNSLYDGRTETSELPKDRRADALRRIFEKYNSPLIYEVNTFIEVSDQYDMDYRILPAIAFSESTLCKNYPTSTNNCYGWGQPLKTFISQREAIQYIAEKINVSSPYYGSWRDDKTDLYKLGTPYNGADIKFWVEKVTYFMEEVE